MHILSFAQSLRGGGVERALLRMAGGWLAAGTRVTLVIGEASGALAHEVPQGIDIIELHDSRYVAMRRLPGIVAARLPDVVFCPGNHYTAAVAWLKLRLGADCPPIVGKVSNALDRRDQGRLASAGYRWWLRRHPAFLDAVVAMTPAMADEAIAAMRMPQGRVHVIANPPTRRIADAPPPPMPAGRFILGVGRLARQKRWDRLIAALPDLRDTDVTLLLLGEGSERESLQALAERLGVRELVAMPGHVPDPLPAIERAAVVALTSDYEGVPGVLREALALGTPAVATESSRAIRELLDSPDRGDIVAPDDAIGLVAALDRWLASDAQRPTPLAEPTADPIAAYLTLFETLAAQRSR